MNKYPNAKTLLVSVVGPCFVLMACQSEDDGFVKTIIDDSAEDIVVLHSAGTSGNGVLNSDGSFDISNACLLYTSPSPRDKRQSRMPSSA